MSGSHRCPDCWTTFITAEGVERHRRKPHTQCPLCPRKMIRVEHHLAWHYWHELKPLTSFQESEPADGC